MKVKPARKISHRPDKPDNIAACNKKIWTYYRAHGRSMPWRDNTSPYYVVISEIMLQQTQVSRVTDKFKIFTHHFPTWQSLAKASVAEVLTQWSGLGYNRRALYLKRIAEKVVADPAYNFLIDPGLKKQPAAKSLKTRHYYNLLTELPGIGPNTTGSILAFAFNIPHPFIETNIRSVFIHLFFNDDTSKVHDEKIMPLLEEMLSIRQNQKNPREWYYALMDYGSYLKQSMVNPSRKSLHHTKQKPFIGSNRELRSKILKLIMEHSRTGKAITDKAISKELKEYAQKSVIKNIEALAHEGFIIHRKSAYHIA